MRLICRGLFIFCFPLMVPAAARNLRASPMPLDVHEHTEVAGNAGPRVPRGAPTFVATFFATSAAHALGRHAGRAAARTAGGKRRIGEILQIRSMSQRNVTFVS